tara:strand:- start:242 stop:397 length:156 start_codon:yes stop_codon:yes gene_type:complete
LIVVLFSIYEDKRFLKNKHFAALVYLIDLAKKLIGNLLAIKINLSLREYKN